MGRRIIEAGHYYAAKGPTQWSQIGWEILERIRTPRDASMLFVDDFHALEDVSECERHLDNVPFDPNPDVLVREACLSAESAEVLWRLKELPRKRRARTNGNGKWYCSGFPITGEDGQPLCVLLDAGLTLRKQQLGFGEGVNIVPCFYEEEQRQLLRLVGKAIPDFSMVVILFDLDGRSWEMNGE